MKRRFLWGPAVCVIAALLSLLGLQNIAAAAPKLHSALAKPSEIYQCSQPYQSRFDGFANYGASYEGVSAQIRIELGSVCDTDTSANNFTTAWSMIASNNGSGGYAQSGFFHYYGGATTHFAEYNQSGGSFTRKFGSSVTANESHRYWQQYDSNCACIHDNVHTTQILSTPFNPFSAWTTPFSEQFFGETKYIASDMPGSAASPTKIAALAVQNYTDAYVSIPSPFLTARNDVPSRYSYAVLSSTAFTINTQ